MVDKPKGYPRSGPASGGCYSRRHSARIAGRNHDRNRVMGLLAHNARHERVRYSLNQDRRNGWYALAFDGKAAYSAQHIKSPLGVQAGVSGRERNGEV